MKWDTQDTLLVGGAGIIVTILAFASSRANATAAPPQVSVINPISSADLTSQVNTVNNNAAAVEQSLLNAESNVITTNNTGGTSIINTAQQSSLAEYEAQQSTQAAQYQFQNQLALANIAAGVAEQQISANQTVGVATANAQAQSAQLAAQTQQAANALASQTAIALGQTQANATITAANDQAQATTNAANAQASASNTASSDNLIGSIVGTIGGLFAGL